MLVMVLPPQQVFMMYGQDGRNVSVPSQKRSIQGYSSIMNRIFVHENCQSI